MTRKQFVCLAIVTLFVMSPAGGDPSTITGEIVDTYCWARIRASGPAHAACGIECVKRGIPAAIVDARTGKAYVLLPGRDKRSVPTELIAAMGQKVTIRGEILTRGGTNFLAVQWWHR